MLYLAIQQFTIVDLDYTPRDLSVTVGTEVTWTNVGQAPHTVTARDQSFSYNFV